MTSFCSALVDDRGAVLRLGPDRPVIWWSFTKTLIAAAVLRLSERGGLALDETLQDLPYTPRDLLSHRAGVGEYGALAEYHEAVARGDFPWTDEELFARVPPTRLLFEPGQGWLYSNVGYLLLRRLLERRLDMDLGEILRDLVLLPLGLKRTRLARSAVDLQDTAFPPPANYEAGWVYHGTLVGPVDEAASALHGLMSGRLLSAPSLDAMLSAHSLGGPLPGQPWWWRAGYGLGLMIGELREEGAEPLAVVGHSAGGPGSVGAVYRMANGRTAAVFLPGGDAGAAEKELLAHLLGRRER